jgi:hypothetical protein
MDKKMTDEAQSETATEQKEQEVSQTVDANIEMDRSFYENDEQSFDKYFLSDAARNGS